MIAELVGIPEELPTGRVLLFENSGYSNTVLME